MKSYKQENYINGIEIMRVCPLGRTPYLSKRNYLWVK